jgi:hypothetical protein
MEQCRVLFSVFRFNIEHSSEHATLALSLAE